MAEPNFSALVTGPIKNLIQWIEQAPNRLQLKDVDGWCLLHHACWKGQLDSVNWILEHGAEAMQIPNDSGFLPIHFASLRGSLDIIRRLLLEIPPENWISFLQIPNHHQKTSFWYGLTSRSQETVDYMFELHPSAIQMPIIPAGEIRSTLSILIRKHSEEFSIAMISKISNRLGLDWISPDVQLDLIVIAIQSHSLELLKLLVSIFPTVIDSLPGYEIASTEEIMRFLFDFGRHHGRTLIKWLLDRKYGLTFLSRIASQNDIFQTGIDLAQRVIMDPNTTIEEREMIIREIVDSEGYFSILVPASNNISSLWIAIDWILTLGGPELLWRSMHQVAKSGYGTLGMAVIRGNLESASVLAWLGCTITMNEYWDIVSTQKTIGTRWLRCLYGDLVIAGNIPRFDGVAETDLPMDIISEEERLQIRFRVYFERSLTSRLLYFS